MNNDKFQGQRSNFHPQRVVTHWGQGPNWKCCVFINMQIYLLLLAHSEPRNVQWDIDKWQVQPSFQGPHALLVPVMFSAL